MKNKTQISTHNAKTLPKITKNDPVLQMVFKNEKRMLKLFAVHLLLNPNLNDALMGI